MAVVPWAEHSVEMEASVSAQQRNQSLLTNDSNMKHVVKRKKPRATASHAMALGALTGLHRDSIDRQSEDDSLPDQKIRCSMSTAAEFSSLAQHHEAPQNFEEIMDNLRHDALVADRHVYVMPPELRMAIRVSSFCCRHML